MNKRTAHTDVLIARTWMLWAFARTGNISNCLSSRNARSTYRTCTHVSKVHWCAEAAAEQQKTSAQIRNPPHPTPPHPTPPHPTPPHPTPPHPTPPHPTPPHPTPPHPTPPPPPKKKKKSNAKRQERISRESRNQSGGKRGVESLV